MTLIRKFRAMVRSNRRSPGGVPMFAIGARIGYWPCLKAPFIQVSIGLWHLELWHGYPSGEIIGRAG